MKTEKRISVLLMCAAVALCLAFTFSFTACKNSDDDTTDPANKYDKYVGAYLDIDDELILSLDESENGYTVIGSLNNTKKQAVIPESFNGLPVTAIDDEAFRGISSLTSVTIPDSVTSIGLEAFYGCRSLTSITIGSGLTTIGESAFQGCTALTAVYYNGSSSDWSQITVGDDNESFTSATVYYYSEDESTDGGDYWHYVNGEIIVWTKKVN